MSLERIARLELCAVDLPLRKPFQHAAAERSRSESLFLKCVTASGAVGFGETLPRAYVTGETRDGAFALIRERILPRLVGRSFAALGEVEEFLARCDGRAPEAWVERAFNLRRYTKMPSGGHFAAMEEPDLWVADIRDFVRPMRFGAAND